MLDVIEAERLALDRDQLLAPWPNGEKPRRDVDVADAPHRIVREYGPDGDRIVEIDPEGELLRLSEPADRRCREGIDIERERVAICGGARATMARSSPSGSVPKA